MEVMNAKDAGDKREKLLDDSSYIAEIKYDGSRYLCDHGRFISRLGKDKTANVPHLHEVLKEYNVILDGEVYYIGGTSNKTTEIMGSKPERAIELQKEQGNIRYVVFDILELNGVSLVDQCWESRRRYLENFYYYDSELMGSCVDLSQVYEHKRILLTQVESQGLEGIMLKNIHSHYAPGKRPEHHWYKLKKHMTYDVVITGTTEGKGKYKGLIGAVTFGLYDSCGNLVPCGQCAGMTDAVRKDITNHPENYIGKVLEIGAMERTEDGFFRHPVWKLLRDDKEAKDCLWNQ
jgi:bifunctional non-homologous end joining protein LigD